MPLKVEEVTDVDGEAEEPQGTSCDEVMDVFLQQLFPLILRLAVSHILAAALQWKHTLLESSAGERWVFHRFLQPCSVHPCASLAQAEECFLLPLRMLGAALVVGRTSRPCGAFHCQQNSSILPCLDAFNTKIHPRVLVPLPPSWVLEHLQSTHHPSRSQLQERVFTQPFFKCIFITWGEQFIYWLKQLLWSFSCMFQCFLFVCLGFFFLINRNEAYAHRLAVAHCSSRSFFNPGFNFSQIWQRTAGLKDKNLQAVRKRAEERNPDFFFFLFSVPTRRSCSNHELKYHLSGCKWVS